MKTAKSGEIIDALKQLRIARDRWLAAKRETNTRAHRMWEWMREKPTTRTVGDAAAYVGISAARDDQREARRALLRAVDALLHHGYDLEVAP